MAREKIIYTGKIHEVVQHFVNIDGKTKEFEIIRRSPGVRLIITNGNKILLTKEFRRELNSFDYRLPGGKVFDTLEEYTSALKKDSDILKHATSAAKKECTEETGLSPKSIKLYHIAKAGATIIWDLYYFVIDSFGGEIKNRNAEGELIYPEWKTFEEAKQMCINKEIQEDRTIGILLRFLLEKESLLSAKSTLNTSITFS